MKKMQNDGLIDLGHLQYPGTEKFLQMDESKYNLPVMRLQDIDLAKVDPVFFDVKAIAAAVEESEITDTVIAPVQIITAVHKDTAVYISYVSMIPDAWAVELCAIITKEGTTWQMAIVDYR